MTESRLHHIISWSNINKGLLVALPMCTQPCLADDRVSYNFSLSSRKDSLCVHFAPSDVRRQRLLT